MVCLILFFSFYELKAQKTEKRFAVRSDVVIDSSGKKMNSQVCNNPLNYIPDSLFPQLTPMRLVRINVHVIQDSNGKHNFSETEGIKWVKQLVEDANTRLYANKKMNLPKDNTTPVYPVPFRYVLTGVPGDPDDDGIYFHRDDSLFCMNKKSKRKDNVYDKRQYDQYGVQKDTVINIFLIEHCPDSVKSPTYKASNDGVGLGSWAKIVGSYNNAVNPVISGKDTFRFTTWQASGLFNHELGHSLGLSHSWNVDDGCDDTPMNPGCWNFNEGRGDCTIPSNNVMDYNAFQISYSPCQLGKISRNFYNDKMSRRFLVNEWCHYDSSRSITIQQGTSAEWNRSADLFGDLIVENNATLILHCTISLPPGARVILMPKATLILDGCILTSRCSEPFDGIEIRKKKDQAPQIFLKNRSRIENVKHPL